MIKCADLTLCARVQVLCFQKLACSFPKLVQVLDRLSYSQQAVNSCSLLNSITLEDLREKVDDNSGEMGISKGRCNKSAHVALQERDG